MDTGTGREFPEEPAVHPRAAIGEPRAGCDGVISEGREPNCLDNQSCPR